MIILVSIYAYLTSRLGYGEWVRIPLYLLIIPLFVLIDSRYPSRFIINEADDTKGLLKAEIANLSLLGVAATVQEL